MEFNDLRNDYRIGYIDDLSVPEDPLAWFTDWMQQAIDAGIPDPNAMVLSTVGTSQKPSSRIVLLKGLEKGSFIFYTNYESRKGLEINSNPFACLLFYWPLLERQIRVEGMITKAEETLSDEYFLSRPAESRIAALISPQSKPIGTRLELEELFTSYSPNADNLVRPSFWGGFYLKPESYEFWQGRPNRLHDRIHYENKNGSWIHQRLAP